MNHTYLVINSVYAGKDDTQPQMMIHEIIMTVNTDVMDRSDPALLDSVKERAVSETVSNIAQRLDCEIWEIILTAASCSIIDTDHILLVAQHIMTEFETQTQTHPPVELPVQQDLVFLQNQNDDEWLEEMLNGLYEQ